MGRFIEMVRKTLDHDPEYEESKENDELQEEIDKKVSEIDERQADLSRLKG